MIDSMMRRGWPVYLLLALYFLVNIIVRLSLPQSLELDEGQQLFLAQWLVPGYDSQPPFYNWLQYGVVGIFGETVFALTILKNTLLFGCYLLIGLTASMLIEDRRLAAIATLGMITIPQISFEAQRDLSHTVAVLFAACLFFYGFLRTLRQPNLPGYLLTGVAIGIGILSKYNFVMLPLAAVLALLPERQYRARLLDPRIILTIVVSAIIVAPHAFWFVDHVGMATERTLGKLTADGAPTRLGQIVDGLASLFGSMAVFSLPTIAIFWVAFGRKLLAARDATSDWTRLIGRIFVILAVALVILVLFGASAIKPRWLVPFFFLLPLYLGLKIDASEQPIETAQRRFIGVVLLIMLVIPAVLYGRIAFHFATGHYEKLNVPYGPAIHAILASSAHRPSIVVADDLQLAGDVRLHSRDIPVMVPGYESLQQPYLFDTTHPVLLIWRGKGEADPVLPEDLATWSRSQSGISSVALAVHDVAWPYHFGETGDLYHFSYAWIYPPK